MAWAVSTTENITLTTIVNGQSYSVNVPGNRMLDMAWSPDGHTLAVSAAVVSNYSGRILEDRVYFVSWPGMLDALALPLDAASEHLLWSADGKTLVVVRRSLDANIHRLDFIPVNAATQYAIPAAGFSLTGARYFYLTHLYWLP
jgi:Tol biopolymer transport system component